MNTWLSLLSSWLLDVLVLGTVVLALALVLMVFLRQPAARMAVAWGTLLGLALLCVIVALPLWPRQAIFARQGLTGSDLEPAADNAEHALLRASTETEIAPLPEPTLIIAQPLSEAKSPDAMKTEAARLSFSIQAERLATAFWLLGSAMASAWIILGAWQALRLLYRAQEPPDWSRKELAQLVRGRGCLPRLKASEQIATALALGAARPHILLAAGSISKENAGQVRAALAHEWAHIRNGDLWLLVLERLLLPVFCLHPLYWLLRRQIRMSQELLADAAAAGENPIEYAEALVAWAKTAPRANPPLGMAALSLWENPCSLNRRVEMLLHSKTPVRAAGSRFGWLTTVSVLALVMALSLLTLRPAAIGQDSEHAASKEGERPKKPKKKKKERSNKPSALNREAPDSGAPRPAPAAASQTYMQLKIGQIDHDALTRADMSIGEIIQEASEDHCRLEGNLIVAELSPEQFTTLLERLQSAKSFTMLSEPQLITLDGREASVQVGSQVPFVRLDEAVNGEARRRVEFKEVGEKISIRPRLSGKNDSRLTLEIVLEHTQLVKDSPADVPKGVPAFSTRKLELASEMDLGRTLVITEKSPRKGEARQPFPLLAIRPETIVVAAPNAEQRLSAVQQENDALRKQVQDLQKKLSDLQVELQWLRAAATPEGKEKVSDEEFLRRVYLDLKGLLPTPEEVRAFLQDKDAQKRSKLIDKLLPKQTGDASNFNRPKESSLELDGLAATTTPPASVNRTRLGEQQIQGFQLANAKASDFALTLSKIVGSKGMDAVSIEVVEGNNAVIIMKGTPEVLALVEALLKELDRAETTKTKATEKQGADAEKLQELEIRQAQAALNAAKAKYDRLLSLRKANAVSEAELESIAVAVKQAELQLQRSKVAGDDVAQLEIELEQAAVALQAAKAEFDRAKKLLEKGSLVLHDFRALQFEVVKREIELERAKARLEAVKSKPKP